MSSRPLGQPQKMSDDRTSNAGAEVRTADGSRRTVDAVDEQCLKCGCSNLWCTVVLCAAYIDGPNIECWCRGTNSWWQPADRRCCRWAMSEVWMQQSVVYCGALCCIHRWTVAHSLYCTRWGMSYNWVCSECSCLWSILLCHAANCNIVVVTVFLCLCLQLCRGAESADWFSQHSVRGVHWRRTSSGGDGGRQRFTTTQRHPHPL